MRGDAGAVQEAEAEIVAKDRRAALLREVHQHLAQMWAKGGWPGGCHGRVEAIGAAFYDWRCQWYHPAFSEKLRAEFNGDRDAYYNAYRPTRAGNDFIHEACLREGMKGFHGMLRRGRGKFMTATVATGLIGTM